MRWLGWVLPLALLAYSACTGNATPDPTKCPTTAQSVQFDTIGSCGDGTVRPVTISTDPGLCSIQVMGSGPLTGLPAHGTFSGEAANTNYQIAAGNWSLHGQTPDPQADPSSTECEATATGTAGALTVDCSINNCVPSGDDTGFQCALSTCVAHLTPHVPGGPDAGQPDGNADAAPDSAGTSDGAAAD